MTLLHTKTAFYFCILIISNEVASELSRNFIVTDNNDNGTWKELSLSLTDSSCRRPSKCVSLEYRTCLGTPLTYEQTSLDLLPDNHSQDKINETLTMLESLKYIPKCWTVVQPLLCAVFMPKCSNNLLDLPSPDTCKKILKPCGIVMNSTVWPDFLRCENEKIFSPQCKNDFRDVKFGTPGKCLSPLVSVSSSVSGTDESFDGIDGCRIPCNDPMFLPDELAQIHSFIAWAAGICIFFNMFTMVTFFIDWRSASKYPAAIIFHINGCFLVSCIGWLVQFTPGSRDVIVCRKDGTPRIGEPSGENISCAAVFIMVYYFSMAALVWFVILTYAWHVSFRALGKIRDKIDKKNSYFHLLAWSIPFVLTVLTFAFTKIDGNSVTGICYVTHEPMARGLLVLLPLTCGSLTAGYFISRALITLIGMKISSQDIVHERASAKIRETIIRIGLFTLFIYVSVIITIYCHIHDFVNSDKWSKSFRDYMWCSILTKYQGTNQCTMDSRPSIAKLQLHLLAHFFAGILMSSWVWTGSTVDTWTRFLRRTFHNETEEPVKLKKHKVIAQAFAKRKTFNNAGRLSISFHHTHEDPVGMNFDLNSAASQDFSSTWAAALPKFVTRRGALVGNNTGSSSSYRRNSVDSEISISVRRFSVESRRNSLDSQISYGVQFAELKTTRKVASSSGHRSRRGKRRREFSKSRSTKSGHLLRRGSTTSQESQLGAQILSALTIGGTHVPNMKRRSATVGLNGETLGSKIIDGKEMGMLMPFLFGGQSASDDEGASSEEKGGNNRDVEAGVVEKNRESESEESEPDEGTKMIEPEGQERSKSSDKSSKSYSHDSGRKCKESRKGKYVIQDETVLKQLIQESKEIVRRDNEKESHSKPVIGDLASSLTSHCPELGRLMIGDGQSNAREMATQTSLPLDVLEMEELKQSIDEIISSRNCSSKGTQISPQLNKGTRRVEKVSGVSPIPAPRPSKEGKKKESKNV
ncbi:protein smoothened [Diachasmimorpha longicaudata]|uniref:protein smoothened n=1 Tax=Diachasmimorpha longicaudata TaxID=58733 RepID=UPI0030B89D14